jgi:hypothetical protein
MDTSRLAREEKRPGLRKFLLAAGALLALTGAAHGEWLNVDCSGGTSGAFTSITAALNALTEPPPTGGHDYILLLGDCTEDVTISGRHNVWIAPEWAIGPWTINPEPATVTGSIWVSGSEVTLMHLALDGGGLGVAQGSHVWAYGVSAEGSSGSGFFVGGNAHLRLMNGRSVGHDRFGIQVDDGGSAHVLGMVGWWGGTPAETVISGNGQGGIQVTRANLDGYGGTVIEDNNGPGLLSHGGDTDLGGLYGSGITIEGNQIGTILREGSEATFWSRVVFRDNGPVGVLAEEGSHLTLAGSVQGASEDSSLVVEDHTEAGVYVRKGSQASFSGRTIVRSNGSSGYAASAGIRVTGTSQAYFGPIEHVFGPVLEEGAEVTGNLGSGVTVDINSSVDLRGATISGNAGEGLRVHHMSLIEVDDECQVFGNAAGPLTCDDTALVLTDVLEKNIYCKNVLKGKI